MPLRACRAHAGRSGKYARQQEGGKPDEAAEDIAPDHQPAEVPADHIFDDVFDLFRPEALQAFFKKAVNLTADIGDQAFFVELDAKL